MGCVKWSVVKNGYEMDMDMDMGMDGNFSRAQRATARRDEN